MKKYNPYYVEYARYYGLTVEEALEENRKKREGEKVEIDSFMLWLRPYINEFNSIYGENAWRFNGPGGFSYDYPPNEEWLKERVDEKLSMMTP